MEPMTLGSPTHSPTGSPNMNILPPFLVGEFNQPTPRTSSLSPTKGRNITFGSSPPNKPPVHVQPQYSTPLRNKPLQNSSFSNKINGPPTQSLFETLNRSDWNGNQSIQSPMMGAMSPYNGASFNASHQENLHSQLDNSFVGNLSFAQNQNVQMNKSYGMNQSLMNASAVPNYDNSIISDTSNSMRYGDEEGDCWITVFGFPPSASNMVVTQFSNCGNILEKKFPPQGNWVWLRFASRSEATRALALNGRILTGSIMIGVTACSNPPPSNRNGPRQLTAGPRLNSSLLSSPSSQGPQTGAQRSTGPLSKALEYVFGW